MTERKSRLALLSVALAAVLIAPSAQAQELKTINVLLPADRATPLFSLGVSEAMGFFAEEGVKVNVLSSETTISYVAFLTNKQADIVMLDAPQTIQAVGANIPIAVVYEAFQYAPEGIAVPADSDITSIEQLVGKTVGLASDRDQATLQISLDAVGIPIEKVKTVVVGDAGPVMATALKNKAVVAMAAGINDWTTLAANGIPTREITPAAVEINPANNFTILKERKEELRPLLIAFLRGWTKGTMAASIDRPAVAAVMREWIPEEWEVEEFGQQLLTSSIKVTSKLSDRWGDLRPDLWTQVQKPMVKFGYLPAEADPATFLDDYLIADVATIDEAAVKATIDKWKAANADKIK